MVNVTIYGIHTDPSWVMWQWLMIEIGASKMTPVDFPSGEFWCLKFVISEFLHLMWQERAQLKTRPKDVATINNICFVFGKPYHVNLRQSIHWLKQGRRKACVRKEFERTWKNHLDFPLWFWLQIEAPTQKKNAHWYFDSPSSTDGTRRVLEFSYGGCKQVTTKFNWLWTYPLFPNLLLLDTKKNIDV